MIITREALATIVMIGSGCRTPAVKKEDNLRYLYRCLFAEERFDLLEIERRLPQKTFMYSGIDAYARSLGVKKIDVDVVYKFFGSHVHIDFVLDQIRAMNLQGDFADKFFFAHMLIPVTITSKTEDNITARYENGAMTVDISNLLVHPCFQTDFSLNKKALVHYAVIVGTPSLEIQECLLTDQASSREFREACRRIKAIDYQGFWDLKDWTQSLMDRCFT